MSYSSVVMPADILIVTVTEEETQAVIDAVKHVYPQRLIKDERTDRGGYLRLGAIAGVQVVLAEARMGDAGAGNAQDTVTAGIIDYQPDVVIAVGIAYGVDPDHQRIGDILLAERLFLWSDNRVDQLEDGAISWSFRGDRPATSATLFSVFALAGRLWNQEPRSLGRVYQGTFASGSTLINYAAFRDWLRGQTSNMIGGEMEGRGIYGGAQGRAVGKARVDWVIIKGICDWAVNKHVPTKAADQRLAALNASHFVISVLRNGGFARKDSFNAYGLYHLWQKLVLSLFYLLHVPIKIKKRAPSIFWETKSQLQSPLHRICTDNPIPRLSVRPPFRDLVTPPDCELIPPAVLPNSEPITLYTIGRYEEENTIVVSETEDTLTISRAPHASIMASMRHDGTWVFSLHPLSQNRTFLNREPIMTPQPLSSGALIELPLRGGKRLEFVFSLHKMTVPEDDTQDVRTV